MLLKLLIKHLSTNFLANLFLVYSYSSLVLKFIFNTFIGALILTIAIYVYFYQFTYTKPLTFNELILWADQLDSSYKLALITSISTIVGIWITFSLSMKSWKAQEQIKIKHQVSDEIKNFFDEACGHLLKLKTYTEGVLETNALLNSPEIDPEIDIKILVSTRNPELITNIRNRISEMAVQVHRFKGKYYTLLSSTNNADEYLNNCVDNFIELAEKMWFRIPNINADSINIIGDFISQSDLNSMDKFTSCFDNAYGLIHLNCGALQGILNAQLIQPNFKSIIQIHKNKNELIDAIFLAKQQK